MRRRDIPPIFLMGLSLFLALAACAGAPPAPEAPPADPAPALEQPAREEPNLNGLNGALDRAEQARKRALDFDAPLYFPPDWEDADNRYQAIGGGLDKTKAEDVKNAVARYGEAAAAFEDLFRKSLAAYAQDREQEINEARAQAVSDGAGELLPEFLVQADKTALEALDSYEAEEYYPAAEKAHQALDRYRVLKTGTEAYIIRLDIEKRNLYRYIPVEFDQADEAGDGAIDAYRADDIAGAGKLAEEARDLYQQALEAALEDLALERWDTAEKERRLALELKADMAVRRNFFAADAVYGQAGKAFQDQLYELAAFFYEQAGQLFVRAQRDTLGKRRLAEDAIRNAEEKVVESEEAAQVADLLLEGGVE